MSCEIHGEITRFQWKSWFEEAAYRCFFSIFNKIAALLFDNFRENKCKNDILVRRLGTRLQFEYFISCPLNSLIYYDSKSLVSNLTIVGYNCAAAAYCIFHWCFDCGDSFFLSCTIFLRFLARDYLKYLLFETLGFLRPKLGTNNRFRMTKHSICWCIGPPSCLKPDKFWFSA